AGRARPAPGEWAANGFTEAAPAAEAGGFFLRVLNATAAPAALCISNECHEMSFLGCGPIGVPVGDAATPGPAGVKVSSCYHAGSPMARRRSSRAGAPPPVIRRRSLVHPADL